MKSRPGSRHAPSSPKRAVYQPGASTAHRAPKWTQVETERLERITKRANARAQAAADELRRRRGDDCAAPVVVDDVDAAATRPPQDVTIRHFTAPPVIVRRDALPRRSPGGDAGGPDLNDPDRRGRT